MHSCSHSPILAPMGQTDTTPRAKTPLTPVDTSDLAVLRAEVADLAARLDTLQAGGEVERQARVVATLHRLTDEYAARLEWFIKVGTKCRDLLESLQPDPVDGAVPDLASILANVSSADARAGGGTPSKSDDKDMADVVGNIMKALKQQQ